MKTHPDDPRTSLPPSVVILGNDAQLAARPATPVQLAHACLAAGYRAAVPGSWGDELIASATIQALTTHTVRPAIQCVCPHVARRVLAVGSDLSPYLVSLVAPPVAAARYVRQHSPSGVRITYVGRCPAASDDSIDARLTPEELLAQLAERGIRVAEQPTVFESVIPPDRRRHRSQPGGLPSPDELWSGDQPTTVEVISDEDLASEIAEKVLAATNSLLDLAPSVGCACAGARAGALTHSARADVVALEPPRASAPVVDEQFAVGLELPLPAAARSPFDIIAPPPADVDQQWEPLEAVELEPEPPVPVAETAARRPRFSPPGIEVPPAALPSRRRPSGSTGRVVPGSMPVGSDQEGRVLPRAYVARRRSPRGGVPMVSDTVSRGGPTTPTPASATPAAGESQHKGSAAPPRDEARAKPFAGHAVEPTAAPRVEPPAQGQSGEPMAESSRAEQPTRPASIEPPRHTSFGRGRPQPPAVEQTAAMQPAHDRSSGVSEVEQPRTTHWTAQPILARQTARSDHEIPQPFPLPAVAPETPSTRPSDAELPIAQSVEPVRANGSRAGILAPTLPVLVDQVRRTTERVSGGVRALVARSPRTAIVAALTAVVLLSVAIGYAAGNRSTDRATSGEAGGQLDVQRFPADTGADPDSLRAGAARRDSIARRAAAAPARRTTGVRRPARTGGRSGAAATEPAAKGPAVIDSTATPPDSARPPAASGRDSAAAIPPLDSAAGRASAASKPPADSAEREALRLELERHRARLDSIARRVQEIKPDQR
jgi:iron only hydrogenase large subunit